MARDEAAYVTNKFLLLFILVTSFIVSTTLLIGKVDPDFFSFYYIGKGLIHGGSMYADFADNKGPLLYGIFAGAYSLFRDNYQLSLILLNTIADTLALFALLKTVQQIYKFSFKKNWQTLSCIVLGVMFYKSFTIGSSMGGVYSTTLEMSLLCLALWAFTTNKNMLAGGLFGLSILIRPSALFFLPFFLIWVYKKPIRVPNLFAFFKGWIFASAIILVPFIISGSITDLVYNTITVSMTGYSVDEATRWITMAYVMLSETRIFFTIVYAVLILFFVLIQKKPPFHYLLPILFLCSLIATFPKGIFSYHHFLQFTIAAFFLIGYAVKYLNRQVIYVVLAFITLFTFSNFLFFLSSEPQKDNIPNLIRSEVTPKKYLMVYPYHPKYYFEFNKFAPDRYFHGLYFGKNFSTLAANDIANHRNMNKEKLRQTLFIIIKDPEAKKESDYIAIFGKTFQLKKMKTYTNERTSVELYESEI